MVATTLNTVAGRDRMRETKRERRREEERGRERVSESVSSVQDVYRYSFGKVVLGVSVWPSRAPLSLSFSPSISPIPTCISSCSHPTDLYLVLTSTSFNIHGNVRQKAFRNAIALHAHNFVTNKKRNREQKLHEERKSYSKQAKKSSSPHFLCVTAGQPSLPLPLSHSLLRA